MPPAGAAGAGSTLQLRKKKAELDMGRQAAASGKHDEAMEHFTAAIDKFPLELEAYVGRGSSAAALSDHERAVYDFSMAIHLLPTVGHCLMRAASLSALWQFDTVPGALADCEQAVQLAEETDEDACLTAALTARAGVHEQKVRWEAAALDLSRALLIFGTEDPAAETAMRGDGAEGEAAPVPARSKGKRAEDDDWTRPRRAREEGGRDAGSAGSGRAAGGGERGAGTKARPSAERQALHADARARRGVCLHKLGRVDEGAVELRRALRLWPTATRYRLPLAAALLEQGDAAGASKELEIGLAATPDDPPMLRLYGRILQQAGDGEQGLSSLQRSAELEPSVHGAVHALAEGWEVVGDRRAALESYDEACAIALRDATQAV